MTLVGRVPVGRRPGPPLDELVDLLGAARALPPQRRDDADREVAATRERRVRQLLIGGDGGILPVRDAERDELGLPETQRGLELGRRVWRKQTPDQVDGALLEGP